MKPPQPSKQAPHVAKGESPHSRLARLDRWMASHPGYPRAVPYFVFLAGLAAIGAIADRAPTAYPFVYLTVNLVIVFLLVRYRKLTPELSTRFHWLAVPVGVGVFLAWVWLGFLTANFGKLLEVGPAEFHRKLFAFLADPANVAHPYPNPDARSLFRDVPPAIGWTSMSLRLLGMAILVPLFEELFIRSLLLRMFHRAKRTLRGLAQITLDLPVIGEALLHTKWAARIEKDPVLFAQEFHKTPLGALSLFGVAASTLLFTIGHRPSDWPGAIVCGVAYCLLLRATRDKGLGPVVWAHAITNALLWAYTLYYGDWQFL